MRFTRKLRRGAAAFLGALLSVWLVAVPLPASAQVELHGPEPGRIYRIGIITYAGPGLELTLKRELARIGYREGENVVYEMRAALRDISLMDRYARELVAWRPDVIVSLMTNAHVAVQRATAGAPVPVVLWSTDPLETGVIKSFREPGTNFTGFSYEPELQMLQVALLKRAVPGLKCIGHLFNHTYAPAPSTRRKLIAAGELLNVPVAVHEVLSQAELEPAIAQMKAQGCGGFVVGPHELFNSNGSTIGQLALKYGLAAVSIQTSVTRGGGLAAYSPPFDKGWPAMAPVIDRLLHGADPSTTPIERSFKSPLTINLGAARALGLELPGELIDEADELLE